MVTKKQFLMSFLSVRKPLEIVFSVYFDFGSASNQMRPLKSIVLAMNSVPPSGEGDFLVAI